ncbi:MAG: energy-coupling factor transporter transmembrane protein EcfT [Asgard group archaeon]|nr:energy-coupling factor transporter transmembrane protein EcfT [Asgard group archaeon]
MAFIQSSKNRLSNKTITLDPRTKLVMLLLMSLLIYMVSNFYLLFSILCSMIILALIAKIPWKKFYRYIRPTIWVLPSLFIIQLIFPINASGPSFDLLVNFGFMSNYLNDQTLTLNLGSVLFALNSCLRIFNLAVGSCLFSLTTNSNDYIQALTKIAIPYSIAFTTGLVIYFLPMVVTETNDTRMALETRGISISRGSFKTRVKNLYLLLTSILYNFLEKSKYQAIALDSRGFNPRKKRSYYRKIEFELIDVSVLIFTIELFCLMCFIFRTEISIFFTFIQYFK